MEKEMKKTAVLLVEDNPGDARLIELMLGSDKTSLRADVLKTDTLNRALIAASEREFDIIILDLDLPDSRGLDTFRAVRSHSVSPIIVLTGHQDESLGDRAVRDGAQDYLIKGQIDGALLGRSVKYSIERSRLERELKRRVDEIERINRMLNFDRDMEVQRLRKEIERLKKRPA